MASGRDVDSAVELFLGACKACNRYRPFLDKYEQPLLNSCMHVYEAASVVNDDTLCSCVARLLSDFAEYNLNAILDNLQAVCVRILYRHHHQHTQLINMLLRMTSSPSRKVSAKVLNLWECICAGQRQQGDDDEDGYVDVMTNIAYSPMDAKHVKPSPTPDVIMLLTSVLDVLYHCIVSVNVSSWSAAMRDEFTEYKGKHRI